MPNASELARLEAEQLTEAPQPVPIKAPADPLSMVSAALVAHDAMIKRSGEEPSDFNRGYRACLIDLKIELQRRP